MHNIPDDCAGHPCAPWNEPKAQRPGDLIQLAAKGDADACEFLWNVIENEFGGAAGRVQFFARCIAAAFDAGNADADELCFAAQSQWEGYHHD